MNIISHLPVIQLVASVILMIGGMFSFGSYVNRFGKRLNRPILRALVGVPVLILILVVICLLGYLHVERSSYDLLGLTVITIK